MLQVFYFKMILVWLVLYVPFFPMSDLSPGPAVTVTEPVIMRLFKRLAQS